MQLAQGNAVGARISASLGAFSSLIAGLQLGGEDGSKMLQGSWEATSALPPLLRTSSGSQLLLGEMEKST